MAITKKKKEEIFQDLNEKIAQQKAIVLVGVTGLAVKDLTDLRKKIKEVDGNLKVAKKTLIEKAFQENKLEFDRNKHKEEMALAFGFKDEVMPAKVVYQTSLVNKKIKILGGFLGGKYQEEGEVIALAQLPGKEELLANLIGSISAPVSNFVYALNYNIKGLITILTKIKA